MYESALDHQLYYATIWRRCDHRSVSGHGHCSRDLAADACTYANICETCPSFTTTAEFVPAITAQLNDIQQLRDDAHQRGWNSEVARHQRVIDSLERHLRHHQHERANTTFA